MAYEEVLTTISASAAADLSAHQFKIVQQTTTGINLANATSDLLGILQDKPAALGRAGSVGIAGVSKLSCSAPAGGAIVAGDPITSSTVGLGVKAVASTSVNVNVIGEAMEALSTAQSAAIISVLVDKRILPADLST